MDENLEGNMDLQHTIATLEKLYLEPDFPKHKKGPEPLEDSLKDLGISRADLWAFAGLVALDWLQVYTKGVCNNTIPITSQQVVELARSKDRRLLSTFL